MELVVLDLIGLPAVGVVDVGVERPATAGESSTLKGSLLLQMAAGARSLLLNIQRIYLETIGRQFQEGTRLHPRCKSWSTHM